MALTCMCPEFLLVSVRDGMFVWDLLRTDAFGPCGVCKGHALPLALPLCDGLQHAGHGVGLVGPCGVMQLSDAVQDDARMWWGTTASVHGDLYNVQHMRVDQKAIPGPDASDVSHDRSGVG